MSGNVAKRFVLLTDMVYRVGLFFRWDSMPRLTWIWMLLCGDDRGKTAKHLLQCQQALQELAVWRHKVNQHW